ncbi:MAG: DNA polymerase III subunit beta [Planctomycetota bacterium]
MKITCNREQLQHAYQAVAAVAPARSPKPILQNVKLEVGETGGGAENAVTLMATDLEVGIRYQSAGVEVHAPGAVVLPVSRFGSILREISDETLKIETDGQKTVVTGERSRFNLPAESPSEFPPVPGFEEQAYYEASARLLKEFIRRTIFATDNESSRYALGGVKMEWDGGRLTAVGTDGRRLAKMEGPVQATAADGSEPAPFGDATIVPSRSLQLIDRVLTDDDAQVQIAVRQNEVLVRSPRATLFTRLLEGRFPRWRDVFPSRSGSAKIELPVGPFFAAVRQAAIVTSDESRGVEFTFGGGSLVLSGHAAEVGDARVEMPIGYDGEEIAIKLDPRYLVDLLKVMDPEKTFTLDLADGDSAAVATTDDGYGYVIMPLSRDR